MAKLTKADAARQLRISRTTLYKLIDQGALSALPDGMIESAELVRVAPVVDSLKERARTSMHMPDMNTYISTNEQKTPRVDTVHEQPWTDVHEREQTSTVQTLVHTLREQMATLQHELQTAREERQAALQERHAAREERALLLQMLHEMQHRYDRLLEAPRVAPVAPAGATPVPRTDPAVAPEAPPDRGAIRRRILELLRDVPAGLTTAELRTHLQVEKPMGHTCIAMLRDGLLRRVGPGRYVAREG